MVGEGAGEWGPGGSVQHVVEPELSRSAQPMLWAAKEAEKRGPWILPSGLLSRSRDFPSLRVSAALFQGLLWTGVQWG